MNSLRSFRNKNKSMKKPDLYKILQPLLYLTLPFFIVLFALYMSVHILGMMVVSYVPLLFKKKSK